MAGDDGVWIVDGETAVEALRGMEGRLVVVSVGFGTAALRGALRFLPGEARLSGRLAVFGVGDGDPAGDGSSFTVALAARAALLPAVRVNVLGEFAGVVVSFNNPDELLVLDVERSRGLVMLWSQSRTKYFRDETGRVGLNLGGDRVLPPYDMPVSDES
jgi:hypothetical protein